MANTVMVIEHGNESAADVELMLSGTGPSETGNKLANYMLGLASGSKIGKISLNMNSSPATGSVTISTPVADDTIVINGVTLTAKASPVGANQFALGASDNETAANLAAKINASALAGLSGVVTAEDATGLAESATITCIADTGKREITSVTCVADTGAVEETDVTCIADTGKQEISSVTTIADTGALEQTTVTFPSVAGLTQADYFVIENQAGTAYAIWFDIDDAGADPGNAPTGAAYVASDVQIEVNVSTGDTAAQVAAAAVAAIGVSLTDITVLDNLDGTVKFTQDLMGVTVDAAPHNANDSGAGSILVSVGVQGAASNLNSTYFTFSSPDTNYYAWFDVNGEGVDPAPGGTGVHVSIAAGASANTIASALAAAAPGDVGMSALAAVVTMTNDKMGVVADTADGAAPTGFAISTSQQGVASNLNSKYFTFSSVDINYYAWLNVNSEGVDPTPGGTGIEVAVAASASASAVASALAAAAPVDVDMTPVGAVVSLANTKMGNVTNAVDGAAPTGFTILVTQQGNDSNLNSSYFTFAKPGTSYYAWFNVNGEGVDPAPGGTGVPVAISAGASANTVAGALAAATPAGVGMSALAAVVTITNDKMGNVTDAADGAAPTGFAILVSQQGAASNLNSKYVTFKSANDAVAYYAYFSVNSEGIDPAPGGTGVVASIAASASAGAVATALAGAIDAISGISASALSAVVTITNDAIGITTDATAGNSGLAVAMVQQGTDPVVTLTAVTPGAIGDSISMSGTGGFDPSASFLSGGSNGTIVELSFGKA